MKKLIALLMTFTLVFSMMVVPTLALMQNRTINGVNTILEIGPTDAYLKGYAKTTVTNGSSHLLDIGLEVYGRRNDGYVRYNVGGGTATDSSLRVSAYAPYSSYAWAESIHNVNDGPNSQYMVVDKY